MEFLHRGKRSEGKLCVFIIAHFSTMRQFFSKKVENSLVHSGYTFRKGDITFAHLTQNAE